MRSDAKREHAEPRRERATPRVLAPPEDPEDPLLPLDPRLREGLLPNQLRYEILPVRNAGQLGIAHLVEHVAFQGTRRFPGFGIVDTLEREGMQFGADINAQTDVDDTIYRLTIATDEPRSLETALDVIRDWAGDVTFDAKAIDHERRVVLEEAHIKGRTSVAMIVAAEATPGSMRRDRPPIGDDDVIAHASRDSVVRYYRDWYRPDLMTVVVVGDVDAAATERMIRDRFGDLVDPDEHRVTPEDRLVIADNTVRYVDGGERDDAALIEDLGPYRRRTISDVRPYVVTEVRARARRLEVPKDRSPFEVIHFSTWIRTTGLSAPAIERAQHDFLDEIDRDAAAPDLTRDAERLMDRAMNGTWFPDPTAWRDRVHQTIATVTRDEIAHGPAVPRMLVAIGAGRVLREKIDDALHDAWGPRPSVQWTKPYDNDLYEAPRPIEIPPLAAGTVTARRALPALGGVAWTLSNGARVVVVRIPGSERISLTAVAPGGTSLAAPDDLAIVQLAAYDLAGRRNAWAR